MDKVRLQIGGDEWSVWSSIQIKRDITSAVSTATLGLATLDPDARRSLSDMKGLPCRILVGDDRVLTGYAVGGSDHSTRGKAAEIRVASRTVDLAQCSHLHSSGVWRRKTVTQILTDLADSYGISVTAPASTPTVTAFRAEPTETAFAAMDRLAREYGYILTDTVTGDIEALSLSDPPLAATAIEEGVNTEGIGQDWDLNGRFSEYRIRGQSYDETDAMGTAADTWFPRRRVMTLDAERRMNRELCEARAKWEAAVRAAGSISYQAVMGSWRQEKGGDLWRPGLLARCKFARYSLDENLLVVGTNLNRNVGGTGTTAELVLGYADGYAPEPTALSKRARAASGTPGRWS